MRPFSSKGLLRKKKWGGSSRKIWSLKRIIFFKMGGIVAGFYTVRNDPIEEEALMVQKRSRNFKGKIAE